MLKMYDFTCDECGYTHEDLVDDSLTTKVCPNCGGYTKRIISGIRFHLDGTDPSFPGAYDQWARRRAKKYNAQIRRKESTGDCLTDVTEL